MQLLCKDGDLALVIHDEDVALANLGKVVRVRGPLNVNRRLQLACWLIEPTNKHKWYCVSSSRNVRIKVVTFASNIEHPDAWLMPLRPGAEGDEYLLGQPEDLLQAHTSLDKTAV